MLTLLGSLRRAYRHRRKIVKKTVRLLIAQRTAGLKPPGDVPRLNGEALERFAIELSRAQRYLEYGSGGSTVMADRLRIPTVSVESDRFYARAVASRLSADSSVRQIVPRLGLTGLWGEPIFSSRAKGRRYSAAPFGEGAFPDFILVDGRYRRACALECARRAHRIGARATMLIDDYAGREHYHPIEAYLGKPEMVADAALFVIGERDVPLDAIAKACDDKR